MERRESDASVRQSGSPGASDQSRIGVLYKEIVKRSKGIIYFPTRWLSASSRNHQLTSIQVIEIKFEIGVFDVHLHDLPSKSRAVPVYVSTTGSEIRRLTTYGPLL